MATLTLLDEYVLLTSFIIGATLLTHALVSLERYTWLEPLFIQGHVAVVVLQHLYSFCLRTAGAAKTARTLGFVRTRPGPISLSRMARRRWHVGRHVVNVVRVFSAEEGKYVEVKATAIEQDEAEA